jgi:uncharacterized protein (TIGR03790 family)
MKTSLRLFASLLSGWLAVAAVGFADDDLSRRVLVVYNETDPESKPLAEYYAQRRGVPTNQICAIHARNAETITRKEFNEQVRAPILQFMIDQGLLFQLPGNMNDPVQGQISVPVTYDNKITFLALIYGVPLRIEQDDAYAEKNTDAKTPPERRRNEASVDSELTWLPSARLPLSFFVPNPFFNSTTATFDKRFNAGMLLVARLDGPDPKIVRRMIDDAMATERTGVLGRAYFDAQDSPAGCGYAEGDTWIKTAAGYVRAAGFETVLDTKPAVFADDFPMTDAAIYAGWYTESVTGAFTRADFKFRPGAVAYHIHSWSASSLRSSNHLWVGPLLARGAAVSFGNVYEPYLSLTPHVDLFFKRLLAGAPFAEAGWYSQPALSWQTVFVGDPIYRPFALSIDAQISRLEAAKNPDAVWAYLRKINLLAGTGQLAEAETLCRVKSATYNSPVLYEKLGDLLADTHRTQEAAEAYLQAIAGASALRQKAITEKMAALKSK